MHIVGMENEQKIKNSMHSSHEYFLMNRVNFMFEFRHFKNLLLTGIFHFPVCPKPVAIPIPFTSNDVGSFQLDIRLLFHVDFPLPNWRKLPFKLIQKGIYTLQFKNVSYRKVETTWRGCLFLQTRISEWAFPPAPI